MPGPLDGIKVVDFSQVVSGPFAAMLLGDQGAEVIKVEPLTGPGDTTRGGVSFAKGGFPALFLNNNRGKRSIGLDLTSAEGRQIALDLCAAADIVVQNFRPGAMERLGLDYPSVKAVNANIIYCSISGFGPTGPYAGRPILDPVIQGLTGIVSRQINPEVPFPDLVRNLISDKGSAFTAAQAITAALFVRERSGVGQHIEVPMLDATTYFFWNDGMMDKTVIDDDATSGLRIAEVYRLTDCADGKIVYFVSSDPMLRQLFAAAGHPEWNEDPRFDSVGALADAANFEALGVLLAEAFLAMTVEEALTALAENSVPGGPILDADQAIADPQLVHNQTLKIWEHPTAGHIQQPRPAARFSETPAQFKEFASSRGQDTDAILAELGATPDQIQALRDGGFAGG